MKPLPPRTRGIRRRSGLGLIEVVMSTLLVGVVLVGAMNLLGAVVRGRTKAADAARAQQFAQQLMNDILNTAYGEGGSLGPDNVLILLVPETRNQFDDVDDFNLWWESPLLTRSGGIIPNTSGWRRSVEVAWVNPSNPGVVVGSNQGLKRITVTVQRSGETVAELSCLRTDKYPPVAPL
jgi:type II secretory pathway pseudopilin PulG